MPGRRLSSGTLGKRPGVVLFARCDEWQTGHTKDGRPFFAIRGREAGLFHMTDQRDCSCPDRQRRQVNQVMCKHMQAVRLWMAAFATGAVAPKPRPGASAADERVPLTPRARRTSPNCPSRPRRRWPVMARLIWRSPSLDCASGATTPAARSRRTRSCSRRARPLGATAIHVDAPGSAPSTCGASPSRLSLPETACLRRPPRRPAPSRTRP
jgi:hypothetical protein